MPDSPITRITDDIIQVQLPLPFALRIVNVYLVRDGDGWAVVDTGIHTEDGENAWRAAWAEVGISPADITQIIVTHGHPDHFGMAGWLQQQAQAASGHLPPVKLSPRERQAVSLAWENPPPEYEPKVARALHVGGMPDAEIQPVVEGIVSTRQMTLPHPDLASYELLSPEQPLKIGKRELQMISAPGHADGQIILYDAADRLLLCGDHVLLKITPNISLWPDSDPEPLRRFMHSLRELRGLNVRLALPGHRPIISDWAGRLDELLAHHDARLARCIEVVRGYTRGATVHEVALGIFEFKYFTHHEWRFAMMEALAHLDFLARAEQLHRETDDNGVLRFHAIG